MRCFFHLVDGQEIILDQEGVEVSSVDHALHQAREGIQELSRELSASARSWGDWELRIVDASGSILGTIKLDEVARGTARNPNGGAG